jgi:hypothetical protein
VESVPAPADRSSLEVDITYLRTCQLSVEIVRNLLIRLRSDEARHYQRELLLPTAALHRSLEATLDSLRAELERAEQAGATTSG